jgi:hypothetical protein
MRSESTIQQVKYVSDTCHNNRCKTDNKGMIRFRDLIEVMERNSYLPRDRSALYEPLSDPSEKMDGRECDSCG